MHIKKIIFIVLIIGIIFGSFKALAFFSDSSDVMLDFESSPKIVTINDNGLAFHVHTNASTVEDFLKEKNIVPKSHDQITPKVENTLYPGTKIEISRAIKIKIEADGKVVDGYTLKKTIAEALTENHITLGRLDKTTPEKTALPEENMKIVVTRIEEEEIIVPEEIDFKTQVKNDSGRGWRDKKIEQKGEKGIREVKYKVTYKNGKEISRVALEKNVTKEPVTQIETQGTYVKIGKAHRGQGTWYAHKGGLYAASPWLPMGSYAKVTNTANGKSVMVEINDRGPFGDGRIIDLDKIAFQKIAALGAGVINVKVEEVLN